MIRPRKAAQGTNSTTVPDLLTQHAEIAGIVDLPSLERFVFVMSVLERYCDQECSLLLGRTRGDVAAARTRALEQLGKSIDLHREPVGVTSNQRARLVQSESAPPLTIAPGLAASA
jgi:DNA-directed RNA polymerase specialized sigma24 family protein